jgi:hypothetical protein
VENLLAASENIRKRALISREHVIHRIGNTVEENAEQMTVEFSACCFPAVNEVELVYLKNLHLQMVNYYPVHIGR